MKRRIRGRVQNSFTGAVRSHASYLGLPCERAILDMSYGSTEDIVVLKFPHSIVPSQSSLETAHNTALALAPSPSNELRGAWDTNTLILLEYSG